jgi:putative molybdopterin biosynthesis protein
MIRIDIRPVWRFRNDTEEREFDFMLLALLESLEKDGKLTLAARQAGISYRHAWNLIEQWAAFFGAPLVFVERGRGTQLSPLGARLLWAGKRVHGRLGPELDNLASEFSGALNEALESGTPALRIHASHDFAVAGLRDLLVQAGCAVDLQYRGSFDALASMARGGCDLAGFHIAEGSLGPLMNRRYAELLKSPDDRLVEVASRTQGFIVAAGNPKGIAGIRDLEKGGVRFVNRQRGSGTRALLEFLIAEGAVERNRILGYETEEVTHAAVAALVAGGLADAGFGVEAAAVRFRLGFVPVAVERYFFACRTSALDSPAMRKLVEILGAAEFRTLAQGLAGYALRQPGRIATAAEVLKESAHA